MTTPPTDAFVPLLAAAPTGPRNDFRVLLAEQPERARPYRAPETPVATATPVLRYPQCEPRVSLQRQGDRIAGIRIECACGQVIDLACVYDPPAPAAEAPPGETQGGR